MTTTIDPPSSTKATAETRGQFDPQSIAKCLQEGKPLKCLLNLDEAVWESMYQMGFHNYQNAQFETAEFWWTQASLFDSEKERNWISLGVVCIKQSRWEQALNAFSLAAHLGSENPWVPLHAAECLIQMNRFDKAMSALKTAELWQENSDETPLIEKRIQLLRRGIERQLDDAPS